MRNIDDILRRAGILGCDEIKNKTNDKILILRIEQLQQEFVEADSQKIRNLSFVFYEVKAQIKKDKK